MPLPRAIFFDLDGTLARSKQPIEASMATLLARLLLRTKVAVTSGGKLEQLTSQVADRLPPEANLANLYFLPTSGAALWSRDGNDKWRLEYEELLTPEEQAHVKDMIMQGANATGCVDFDSPGYGEYIELRGAQVTLSALGQQAPIEEKKAWDPSHEKRRALQAAIAPLLPGYDVKIGGATSIDVTRSGVNKAYGIRQFSERYDIPVSDMLYVGDELASGGNDSVALETGIASRAVENPEDTARFIEGLLGAAA